MNEEQHVCPRCKQEFVEPVMIKNMGMLPAWLCTECEAFWANDPTIKLSDYTTFPEFMRSNGLTDDWNNIIFTPR